MKRFAGVDEAGRGCVLGPLVVGIVVATDADRRQFRAWNVRDSKKVPPKERTMLAARIAERCWHAVRVAVPKEIDAAVRDRSRTLNGLERELMAALLRDAQDAHAEMHLSATVDAPSINAARFQQELTAACAWDARGALIACHRADETDVAVSAASIIAKHERERLLAVIKKMCGVDFGSGYPHDPRTIDYIKNTAPLSKDAVHVRWSWATAQRVHGSMR